MAGKSRTCASCLQMQEKLAQAATHGPATMTCAYGLCETEVPVKLGAQTIGFLQTGQFLRHAPPAASFERAVRHAREFGVDLGRNGAKETYFNTQVISQEKLDAVSGLLSTFADHLSMKSNQIAVQAANDEPPVVMKAKQFIREHVTEDFSLGQVAAVRRAAPAPPHQGSD